MNPYKVLGVSENATQEEIRAAYLQLVKKYHPDKYADNPLKELANEKLKQINEAYEMLTRKASNNTYERAPGSGGYGYQSAGAGTYSGPDAAQFAKARSLINQNNLQAAKQVLDSIANHNAEWYYLYGIIFLRQGWYDKAKEYFARAYEQEPGNAEYRNAYTTVSRSGNPFSGGGAGGGQYSGGCSGCDVCSSLLCADCCCECMGGDLIRCC